ncbi:MAG: hybrid sensor histidine kinase/response regulator [Caulobacteraceae bacterium]|nr:hybrid sensor histidine kinase/response regulator [Caulobacteraceae bacterium]
MEPSDKLTLPPLTAKVLIVDDDERNAFAATEALASLGHELIIARSGEEALRCLLTHEFAVILLDLHMPGMDGYETARLIREHPRTRDTPIVFVTAVFRDEAHIFQAYTAGAVDVVFKPADPFILRSKVAILVDLYLKTLEVRRQADQSRRLLEENARVSAEKSEAEAALRRSHARQDAILQSLPIVFTSRAPTHPFGALFVSDSITPMTGFAPMRFVEEPEIGLGRIHPDDVSAVADCLLAASETGAYACEYRWQCADGNYRVFLDQGVLAPRHDGDGMEIIGTILDVTDRRSLEEQLAQARKMEAVGQLTGGVAHDFNNLLTVVLGNADILLRRGLDDDKQTRQVGAIRQAAERGQTLTRQLLAFSRRQQLNPVVVELNGLVRDFAPLLQQAIGEGVTLDLTLSDAPVCAHVDPNHLENALLNLAVNARDAMVREGTLSIRVDAETPANATEGRVLITVSDTGAGMAPEVAARIFEPFYTTKEVGKGSGLGLSQVYGFVRQSGGEVTVDTALDRGAAFTLSLPRSAEPAESRAQAEPETLAKASERVLIVEDDPEVLNLCVDLLESQGYRCDTAANAAEALDRLEGSGPYDLLFSDVVMPGGMTGIQLARQAVERFPRMRILLTSGYVGETGLQEAHEFEVIDKPYEQVGLSRRLRLMLDAEAVKAVA